MLGGNLDIGPALTITLPAAGRYKLLVVDDNPDVGGLFRRYLRGEGYRVLQATSGAAAVRLASEFRPDLVVLDVLLPDRDGWEILSDLRATPGMAETPLVICSVLPEEAIHDVRVLHRFSFVEVDPDLAERTVEYLDGTKLKGKEIRLEVAKS